jgi:hypothetical protein
MTVPSSQLQKKHNPIAYHRVREAIEAKIVRFAHLPSTINIADVLTKPLPVVVFQRLVTPVLFREPPTPPLSNTTVMNTTDIHVVWTNPVDSIHI